MANTITVDMNSYTVKQDIAAIPNKLLEGAEEAILQVAYLMKGLAQVHVRVLWGNLRDSIRVERGGQGLHWRQIRVRAGGYLMQRGPQAGKPLTYARIIEEKYPYMRPAWEGVQPEATAIINRLCLDEVSKLPSVKV